MIYNCNQCDRKFHRSDGLEDHIDNVHRGLLLTCEYCNQTFKKNGGLKSHIYKYHKTKTFECKHCRTEFPSQDSLKTHQKTSHVDPKKNHCKQCDFSNRSKQEFDKHLKSVHNEYVCKLCDSKFNSAFHLRSHNNVTHLHKNSRIYPCKKCNYETHSKANFEKHLMIHEGFVNDKQSKPVTDVNDERETIEINNEVEIVEGKKKIEENHQRNPSKQVFNVFSKEFALLREKNLNKVIGKNVPVVDIDEGHDTTIKQSQKGAKRIFNVFSEEFKALRKANMSLNPSGNRKEFKDKIEKSSKRKDQELNTTESYMNEILENGDEQESSNTEIMEVATKEYSIKEIKENNIEKASLKKEIKDNTKDMESSNAEMEDRAESTRNEIVEAASLNITTSVENLQYQKEDKNELKRRGKYEKTSKWFEHQKENWISNKTNFAGENIGSSVLQYFYEGEQHFPCKYCPFESTKIDGLRIHMKRHEREEVNDHDSPEEKLEKEFIRNFKNYKKYLMKYQGSYGVACSFCEKKFDTYWKGQLHIDSKHFPPEKGYTCKKCKIWNHQCKSLAALLKHLHKYHEIDIPRVHGVLGLLKYIF